MLIEFKKTQNTQKEPESKNESPMIFDKSGNPITNPELIAEIQRIESAENKTTAERIRLYQIKKHGDHAKPHTLAKAAKNNNKKRIKKELQEINQPPKTITQTENQDLTPKIKAVIAAVEQGNDPVRACKLVKISYKDFLKEIEKPNFLKENEEYKRARVILADTYIYKINALQEKLLEGLIDNCTYSAITRDLLYLAGKFAPATFGDKISIDKTQKVEISHTVDPDRIASLNKMLSLPASAIDAEFEEVGANQG